MMYIKLVATLEGYRLKVSHFEICKIEMNLVTKMKFLYKQIHVQTSASAWRMRETFTDHNNCDEYSSNMTYLSNVVIYG